MKTSLFIIFQLLFFQGSAQIDSASVSIIESILRKEHPSGTLVYTKWLDGGLITEIEEALNKRKFRARTRSKQKLSFSLSKKERNKITDDLKRFLSQHWKDSLFTDSKRILNDSIWSHIRRKNEETNRSIFRDSSTMTYVEHLVRNGNTFQFSPPIFLRDRKFLIFYYIRQCGTLCGVTDLSIYRRVDGVYKKEIPIIRGAF